MMNGRLGENCFFGWRRAGGVLLLAMAAGVGCDGAIPRAPAAQAALAGTPKPACPLPEAPPCQGGAGHQVEPAAAVEVPGPVDVGRSPARGPAQAPITLVLFSDFECPFCGRVETTLAAREAA
jgi:hypothetical protein